MAHFLESLMRVLNCIVYFAILSLTENLKCLEIRNFFLNYSTIKKLKLMKVGKLD